MQESLKDTIFGLEDKYKHLLHLTANENTLSPLARRALNSELSDRYSMSNHNNLDVATFGRNAAYKSLFELDDLYDQATAAVNKMLSAEYSSLYCLTGAHAMACVLLSITQPGDTVMTVPSNQGGHFCTTGILELTGRKHVETVYDPNSFTFDVRAMAERCKQENVKVIYLDTSVYLKPHPIKELRAHLGNDVVIVYDASHTLGLIMGGAFQDPLAEGADIISANTHKTFPGPHKAIIAFKNKKLGVEVEKTILKNFVSSTQTNSLLSLIVTIFEMKEFGEQYAKQTIKNSNELARCLVGLGLDVRRSDAESFTHNHQVHLFSPFDRVTTVQSFLKNNVSLGTSGALGDRLFIRLGTQEITRRGFKEADMHQIAKITQAVFAGRDARKEVGQLLGSHQTVEYGYTQ